MTYVGNNIVAVISLAREFVVKIRREIPVSWGEMYPEKNLRDVLPTKMRREEGFAIEQGLGKRELPGCLPVVWMAP